MLAVIRQIAYGLATVIAGFLVVALANSIWAALLRADTLVLYGIEKPPLVFVFRGVLDAPPWWLSAYAFGPYEAFIGVGVVMWLIAYAIRRGTKSMSFGRPA
jgi:hypothetical protein